MTVVELRAKGAPHSALVTAKGLVAALDIGTTKITCLIGEAVQQRHHAPDDEERPGVRILGFGHQASRGVRNGMIVDVDQAERAIRLAVDAAERSAKRTISSVFVNVAGGRPQSLVTSAKVKLATGQVTQSEIEAATAAALSQVRAGTRIVLHAVAAQFQLDDARGITSPLGMFGDELTVDVHAVLAAPAAMRNLSLCLERCHLAIADQAVAPYAAAKSVLAEDELKLGVTLVDMGGATTSIAGFREGHVVFADVIPLGGQHITNDIARGLSTTIAHAERMKTLWGSALASAIDEREMVAVPLLGERGVDTVHHVPRSMLTGIIRPRLDETFDLIRERIERASLAGLAGGRVVLTGGASQLTGVRETASQWLNRQVRLGTPLPNLGLPEVARSPGFAVAAGLLLYGLKPDRHCARETRRTAELVAQRGYLRRVGKWITESF
jgi:cell division protein FtsA